MLGEVGRKWEEEVVGEVGEEVSEVGEKVEGG